jgi:hypothetical protein
LQIHFNVGQHRQCWHFKTGFWCQQWAHTLRCILSCVKCMYNCCISTFNNFHFRISTKFFRRRNVGCDDIVLLTQLSASRAVCLDATFPSDVNWKFTMETYGCRLRSLEPTQLPSTWRGNWQRRSCSVLNHRFKMHIVYLFVECGFPGTTVISQQKVNLCVSNAEFLAEDFCFKFV